MLPMTAYCNRCSGLASALAPTSSRKQLRPVDVGIADPIAGRSIPGIRCKPKSAAAITAPLLPALTKPLTRPSSTIWIPRTIEEDFLVRTACAGCRQCSVHLRLDADKDDLDAELAVGLDAARHHLVRGEITTHRIERDFH